MPEVILWIKISLMVVSIGMIGRMMHPFLSPTRAVRGSAESSLLRDFLIPFLSGLGILSVLFSLLASMGWFHLESILGALGVLLVGFLILRRKRNSSPGKFGPYLGFCLLLGGAVFGYTRLIPPFESVLYGNDSSVYIAAGLQLARGGNMFHEDPLLQEMSPEERQIFDFQGGYVRHPGSVHFIDRNEGIVGFVFFPLFPGWLAAGIYFLGIPHFLSILSLFAVLSLILVYRLGYELNGHVLGVSTAGLFLVFYPQLYFSSIPFSEIVSQTLYLGGLWVVLQSLKGGAVASESDQRLAGVLWGCVFLCRIDLMFFIILSVIVIFLSVPSMSANARKWRTFLVLIALFFLFTFYRQIATGLYLELWGLGGNVLIRYFWTPVIPYLHTHAKAYPLFAGGVFLLVAVAIGVGGHYWGKGQSPATVGRMRRISGLLIGFGIVIVMIGTHTDPGKVLLQLYRISLYTEVWVLSVLFAGFGLFVLFRVRKEDATAGWVCLILFLLPTVFYINRPLNVLEQPFFIRRFVPITFPMLFLLSFAGWKELLYRGFRKPLAANILLCLLMLFPAGALYKKSSYLLKEPLYADLMKQARKLSEKIPEKALVLLPSVDDGKHMSMCMQYLLQRDVISFPIHEPYNPELNSYLTRIIRGSRPVLLLVVGSIDYVSPVLEYFDVTEEFVEKLAFYVVPPVDVNDFPGQNFFASLDYRGYRLREKGAPVLRSDLRFDDPELTFLRFHSTEQAFRWTTGEGELKNFYFDTGGKSILIRLRIKFLPEGYVPEELAVVLNGKARASFVGKEGNQFIFRVSEGQVGKITAVSILSPTFVPSERGISPDPRTLGVPFVSLRFEPVS